MTTRVLLVTQLLALLCGVSSAVALPDLRQPRTAGPLTVYPDDVRRNLFYYPPGEIAVGTRPGGEPDVRLLHARYTGSAATGDRGRVVVRSILSIRVVMSGPSLPQVAEARKALTASIGGTVELRPLSVRRLESALVYAAIAPTPAAESPAQDAKEQALPSGHFEAAEGAAPREGYWTERNYTLGLGPEDAQLLSTAFERGGLALTVGYAFLSDGIGPDPPLQELSGSPAVVNELKKLLESRSDPATGDAKARLHVVRAGAVAVRADTQRWPNVVQRVDINDSAPPGYAALDVYCYDFNQTTVPDLYEKQVEIEAEGVGRQPVRLTTTFSRSQPDLYARSLRFPVAVRLDRPYRFRVVEIAEDGTSRSTPWRQRGSWTELLDVTAQGNPR